MIGTWITTALLLCASVLGPATGLSSVITSGNGSPSHSATAATPAAGVATKPCPVTSTTWRGVPRFWTSDRHCYTAPWFSGRHRVMIHFGCNTSPWYPRAQACRWRGGVHHGVDLDMPVGTPVYSGVAGRVHLNPPTMGTAYGRHPLLVRANGRDHVLGHLSRLAVRDGQRVRAGQLLGWSGMSGVEREDGPHLHLEVRPAGGGFRTAVAPERLLGLRAVS